MTTIFSLNRREGVRVVYDLKPVNAQKSFYGKAQVFEMKDGSRYLKSYDTFVCKIEPDGTFFKTWNDYSDTTKKHVNAFRIVNGLNQISKKEWNNLDYYPVK